MTEVKMCGKDVVEKPILSFVSVLLNEWKKKVAYIFDMVA